MSQLLTAAALVALSVSDLEDALKANTYPEATLKEALKLENEKEDTRKTAIEALEGALPDAAAKAAAKAKEEAEAEAAKNQTVIAPGKAVTSLKGILEEGTPVSADMFPGGQKTFNSLKEKGFIK